VDYWIGDHAHVVTILVATPEDDYRTRVYTRMGVRYGWLTPLVTRYVQWVTRKVVAQDIAILNSQAERIRRNSRRPYRRMRSAWLLRIAMSCATTFRVTHCTYRVTNGVSQP